MLLFIISNLKTEKTTLKHIEISKKFQIKFNSKTYNTCNIKFNEKSKNNKKSETIKTLNWQLCADMCIRSRSICCQSPRCGIQHQWALQSDQTNELQWRAWLVEALWPAKVLLGCHTSGQMLAAIAAKPTSRSQLLLLDKRRIASAFRPPCLRSRGTCKATEQHASYMLASRRWSADYQASGIKHQKIRRNLSASYIS